jgi:hypothetical protein
MRYILILLSVLSLIGGAALADPDKDESGNGRWRGDYWSDDRGRKQVREYAYRREYKEEFWDGNCKIERKWERNGDYKEERKCKARWD